MSRKRFCLLNIKTLQAVFFRIPISFINGISCSKLSHSFREMTGYPVLEYLTMCRMTKARSLLSETDLPVTQIAAAVGYCSVTNFSRMFRLKNNCTPSAYRTGARSYKPFDDENREDHPSGKPVPRKEERSTENDIQNRTSEAPV